MRSIVLSALVVSAAAGAAQADIHVGGFGVNGWYSSDSRSTSGTNLRGSSYSHASLPGVFTPADDATIASQIKFADEGSSPSPTGNPLTLTGTAGGNGAMQLSGTTSNSGKSNMTRRGAFGAASQLHAPEFMMNYRQFTISDSTFRTPGLNITVLGTNSNSHVFVHVAPAHTAAGVWTTSNVTSASLFHLYNNGAPGGAVAPKSMADWLADPTWGPIVFGSGASITEIGFTIGSSQRGAYVYLDWVESNLMDGGVRNDFVPAPGAAGLLGVGGLAMLRRRRR